MRKLTINLLSFFLVLGFITTSSYVDAQTRRAYRVSDRAVDSLLTRIETKTDKYKRSMNSALDNSVLNNTNTEDNVFEYITDFENSTDKLKQRFDAKESVDADVTNVLSRAAVINNFMKSNRLNIAAQRDWSSLRTDLNILARYYSVSFDFNAPIRTNTAVYTKPYRVADDSVKALLMRIETNTDIFKRRLDNALDRSSVNNTNAEDNINDYVKQFENSTDRLKQRFDDNESVAADVETVLNRAASINMFMKDNTLARGAERQWMTLRNDLNTLATYYNVSFDFNKAPMNMNNSNNSALAYTVAGSNVKTLLSNLETKTDTYKRAMNVALDRSVLNNSRSEDAIFEYITEFENATDKLKHNFDAGKSTDANVQEVLNRAGFIDAFMRDYRLLNFAERQWVSIRNDLNMLSNYYAVNWKWDRQYEPMSRFDSMITGTYRLNTALSDNVDSVVENAIKIYPARRENRVEENLKRRLDSPNMLVIQKSNQDITVASGNGGQIMFKADGVARNETNQNGRSIKVTANTSYDGVALSYEGERLNDYYVNFMPLSNGRLRVIRRINLDRENESVTVASVYDKVSETAQWNTNSNGTMTNNNVATNFVIPNGTQVMAVLRNNVSTKSSQDGDRFTMEVTSPSQYQGAIIEGRVVKAERSGTVSGRANVSLDFDTIRLRNGQTYKFAGIIDSVTLASGEKVTVNNEGTVRDNNQTSKTVTRAGIGAGVGAILGAILGGGQGAAIGAAIGAAGGAGTVLAQGRDDVELDQGTQVMITASAPNSVRN
ncbi:MAG: hypothetical protein M3405_12795 [Acidobacteriota bacterium]|nr:hypothetical protein [Acidobacteriota bacterium]